MFPMKFERRLLESLPVPDEDDVKRVRKMMSALAVRRVLPYFRQKRGTEATLVARLSGNLAIQRLEDPGSIVNGVSFISQKDVQWIVHVHERVFDYIVFVLPEKDEARLGGTTSEEGKILAFSEFLLRHQIEHILYPDETERDVVHADIAFAMDRRLEDPTFYGMLRNVLEDEMNGLNGAPYFELLNAAELGKPYDYLITRILNAFIETLTNIPESLLHKFFILLDRDQKVKLIGECFRMSRDPAFPLLQRAAFLRKVLTLFEVMIRSDESEAQLVFNLFKDRWGFVYLFHELGLADDRLEDMDQEELFVSLKENLHGFMGKDRAIPMDSTTPPPRAVKKDEPDEAPVKTLKERIEEARNDPDFPQEAILIIDKNKTSAVGHSGPKYTELIETLLAIPWGRIHEIRVTPEAFEAGLDRTHYGLQKPKELICDFFTNLIWRYRQYGKPSIQSWHHTGSAFLFVGPPGVGKTSLAISIARSLEIPYHKVSLGGMKDEADLKGYGFTYEGSKPGAMVQGLIKMGTMNGMFILDEADKTEKFAIAPLLEILDPEQNHLFHDKYTETTLDIDLSNCHFILTANTLETVPPPVLNRCEIIHLDRYSVDEKTAIASRHLIQRVRGRYGIGEDDIAFDPEEKEALLRYLITQYTYEPGVRELERIIRKLFLRMLRKEVMAKGTGGVRITRLKIKRYLEAPRRPRQINEESLVGEALGLGVNLERGIGSLIPIQATRIRMGHAPEGHRESFLSMIHATGNIEKVMDESRKVATTGILHCAEDLGVDLSQLASPIHLHFMGTSRPKDGPSAGGAIALALSSALSGRPIRRDVAMTGEIDTQGRISGVGGLAIKLETAIDAGCKTLIISEENLEGQDSIARLPDALKREIQILTYQTWKENHKPFDYERHLIQIVAVDHIVQAGDVAFIRREELDVVKAKVLSHARDLLVEKPQIRTPSETVQPVLFIKSLEELVMDEAGDVFWKKHPCLLLFQSLGGGLPPDGSTKLHQQSRIRPFNPKQETLRAVLHEIMNSKTDKATDLQVIGLMAPYFFLKRDGIRLDDFPPSGVFAGLLLFANNFTVQCVKIKTCKPVLNRVHWVLSHLNASQLDRCPFLKEKEGIHLLDLSVIPEKYRLDLKHAESILNEVLGAWLDTLFNGKAG